MELGTQVSAQHFQGLQERSSIVEIMEIPYSLTREEM